MSSAGDSSLLFGEISGSALAGIEAALSRFLKPLLSESDGWGKADTEQKVGVQTCCLLVVLSSFELNFLLTRSTERNGRVFMYFQ